MELRQLECFLICARCGSLTQAAEELYTTQPHVSMIIKSLERELGCELFHRKARGVELSEAGKRIYTYANNAVRNAEAVRRLSGQPRVPLLRIASNPSSHMAMLLTHFYRQYPEHALQMQYTECGIEPMIDKISDGMADLGFLFVPKDRRSALKHLLERRNLEFVPLLTTDLVLYVRKQHPLYGREEIAPEELAGLRFLQLDDDYFSVEDILEDAGIFRGGILPREVSTNSGHMMIQMLEHSDLCNIGSYWLSDLYRQHDFGRIRIRGFEQTVQFGYMTCRGKVMMPELKEFLAFLTSAMKKDHREHLRPET